MSSRTASSIWSSSAPARSLRLAPRSYLHRPIGQRFVHVSATPSTPSFQPEPGEDIISTDARFEVLGAPYSLLSVSLSASQNLYTRRGTLVAVSGKPENTVSTLSVLEPFRRAVFGIPFLYQRISSTSPITALISSKSPITSFSVVHLDGRLDWMIAQRRALLAWTGHNLAIRPRINRHMSLAHWGSTQATGRGLLGLVGEGQIYQIKLRAGEEYVVHPANVVAYTMTQHLPQPFRFKSNVLKFQIPSITGLLPDTNFMREMKKTQTWKVLAQLMFNFRTWARRSIWGDRLFLRFEGPTTILLQTRGARLSDVLTTRDINEIADSPAGAAQEAAVLEDQKESGHGSSTDPVPAAQEQPTTTGYATVGDDKKVKIEKSDS